MILYFSGTGNSLYVTKEFGDKLYSIPQAIKNNEYKFSDEKIGIVFPVYENTLPNYIKDFLNKVELNSDYIYVVATYGILSGHVGRDLTKIASENGYEFSYINEINMVDNYIPGFDMKKQIETEHKKNIEENIKKIKNDIDNSVKYIKKDGVLKQSLVSVMHNTALVMVEKQMGIRNRSFDNAFSIDETCISCGICTKVCPAGNIELIEGNPTFKHNCTTCLSCSRNCPKGSIRIKTEKSRNRYRNKNVTLKEIIDSNTQITK